jgi:hypothetical protein
MRTQKSEALFARAQQVIPGGVNSPVRAFRSVGSDPPFLVRGQGAHVWDADGNRYIDYVGSWGPLILGHSNPKVLEAIIQAARNGTSFGASTPTEADLAALVVEAFPAIEKVRFVRRKRSTPAAANNVICRAAIRWPNRGVVNMGLSAMGCSRKCNGLHSGGRTISYYGQKLSNAPPIPSQVRTQLPVPYVASGVSSEGRPGRHPAHLQNRSREPPEKFGALPVAVNHSLAPPNPLELEYRHQKIFRFRDGTVVTQVRSLLKELHTPGFLR